MERGYILFINTWMYSENVKRRTGDTQNSLERKGEE